MKSSGYTKYPSLDTLSGVATGYPFYKPVWAMCSASVKVTGVHNLRHKSILYFHMMYKQDKLWYAENFIATL